MLLYNTPAMQKRFKACINAFKKSHDNLKSVYRNCHKYQITAQMCIILHLIFKSRISEFTLYFHFFHEQVQFP